MMYKFNNALKNSYLIIKYSYIIKENIISRYDTYQNLIFRLDIAYILGSLKLNDTVNTV